MFEPKATASHQALPQPIEVKRRSWPGKLACVRLLATSQELWQPTCSGWRSHHHSRGLSAQFRRSGIAKFVVHVCPSHVDKIPQRRPPAANFHVYFQGVAKKSGITPIA